MTSIRERAAARIREIVLNLRPVLVASTGFLTAAALMACYWQAEAADRADVARGKYLVTLGSCTDCHTPGYFFGKPDEARLLGGSEVGFEIPGLGVFHGPNLTRRPGSASGASRTSSRRCAPASARTAASLRRSCRGARLRN
jgi:mono/diheme cytochrome c family protein